MIMIIILTLNPPSGNLLWTKPFWISDMRLFITSPSSSFPFCPFGDGVDGFVPLGTAVIEKKIKQNSWFYATLFFTFKFQLNY